MGAYDKLKRMLTRFTKSNVIAYFRNKKSSIIIYRFNERPEVIVVACSNKSMIFSSTTICMDEFLEDKKKLSNDDRIGKSVRDEFLKFCDEHYNLINNLYGRDF